MLDKNLGACTARNKGAEIAEGEYLFFCDSDVVLDPTIFEKMIQKLHVNDSAKWCYCNFNVGTTSKIFKEFNIEELRNRNLCSTMSLMKTEVFPGFREDLKRLQDWDVFLTLAEAGHQGIWINENLFKAADRPGISKNSISWVDAIADLRKYHPYLGKNA